jgi:hydrogenase maturation protease
VHLVLDAFPAAEAGPRLKSQTSVTIALHPSRVERHTQSMGRSKETRPRGRRARNGRRQRLLVIGCGNWLAGDDAAGLELARRLRQSGLEECGARDLPRLSLEVLDLFEKSERVLFLDAVMAGAPVGTLHLVPLPWPGMEPRSLGSVTTHGWGIAEIVRLAKSLHRRLPKLYLLGIEIESIAPGTPLSPAVRGSLERAAEGFAGLRRWLLSEGERLTSPRSFPPEGDGLPGNVHG